MTEALTKQPALAELKVAARVLLEEDPSLMAARYSLRMQEAKDLLDESIRQSKSGTKTHLDHLVARLRKSNDELALPPGSPGRFRAILDFLTLWRPADRNEVLRWDDLRPFLQETHDWLRGR